MLNFLGFLGEGFPFKKPGGPPKGGGGKPPFGGTPPPGSGVPAVTAGPKTAEGDAAAGLENGTEAILAMQKAKEEKEAADRAAVQQKAEVEQAERERTSHLRAMADDAVAAALRDKFNDGEDEVEFYPELMSFQAYTSQGNMLVPPNVPTGDTGKATAEKMTKTDSKKPSTKEESKMPVKKPVKK